MELLLTPVVSRLLRRFIKSADGQASSNLRVSLSRGSVVLHNLELDLDELLHKLPLRVERAFARQLRIVIPWTSLATQPIQVALRLGTSEVHSRPSHPGLARGCLSFLVLCCWCQMSVYMAATSSLTCFGLTS